MRPQVLTMVAFGPFATKQVIDFTSLGENPLFLINGPTGAGKTTILDAICFALYGKTTGDEREGSQMRCDLAAEDLLTEVSFQFQLGTDGYLIRRVPEQQRLKKSGDGHTVQKSEAQLYRIEPDGEHTPLVATKVSEATVEIELLTGLDVDQFRQVMVLPQGKFRELLMADSKAREKIFSQLFQTHIYRKIEDKLKFQAANIRNAVREHRNKRDGMLLNIEVSSDDALRDEISGLEPRLTQAKVDNEQAKSSLISASKQLEAAKVLINDFNELGKLEQAQAEFQSNEPLLLQRQQQLDSGHKAQQLKPLLDGSAARDVELKQAQTLMATAQQAKQQGEQALIEAKKHFDALPEQEQQLQQLQQQLQQLSQLVPQLSGLDELYQAAKQASSALQQAKLSGSKSREQFDELQQQIEQLKLQIPALEDLAAEQVSAGQAVSHLSEMIERYQGWLQAKSSVQQTEQQLAQAKQHGQLLRDKFSQAQLTHRQLQLVWHQGQAASLAMQLNEGQPCPVCGSEQHPNLATSDERLPSEEELTQAQQAEENANSSLNQARSEYAALQTRLQEQQKLADELQNKLAQYSEQSVDELQQQLLLKQQLLAKANQGAEQLSQLRSQINEREASAQQQRNALELERERFQELQQQVSSLQGKVEQAENHIPADYRSLDALQSAIKQLTTDVEQRQQTINATRHSYSHARELDASHSASVTAAQQSQSQCIELQQQALNELNTALAEQGFDSQQALQQALLPADVLQQIAAEIANEQQQRIENQARLSQLNEKLAQQVTPNLTEVEQQVQQAQVAQQTAETAWQALQGRMTQLVQTQKQLEQADAAAKQLEDEYAVVGTLADVANGQTGNKISLQRFVLSVLLDDVLLAASERLQLMSKGRYRLLRKEDRAKGNKASGLELEVEDAYTAKVRPVATLSGGESFMAALSMALGLSDVVQAYAGGIKLDTLFIDEGFGSLDQDSLELAIRTLIDLQSAGRMVGVISHVSEMKEQISSRIEITKSANGSITRVCRA